MTIRSTEKHTSLHCCCGEFGTADSRSTLQLVCQVVNLRQECVRQSILELVVECRMCWQVRAFTITTPLASISLLAVSRGNSVPVSPVPQAQQELNNTAVFADTGVATRLSLPHLFMSAGSCAFLLTWAIPSSQCCLFSDCYAAPPSKSTCKAA